MDDELLIALVRAHPAFYDVSDPAYNDNGYKYNVWRHISSEMNVDVSSCKTRWNNLRDNYRKSLKKNAARFAQAKKTKLYKYADQLCFLDEFFEERRAKGSNDSHREEEFTDDAEEAEPEEDNEVDKKPDLQLAESLADFSENFQFQMKHEENFGKRKLSRRTSYSKVPVSISGRPEFQFDEHDHDVGKVLSLHREHEHEPLSPHPVDAFLAGIAPTMKTFSPYFLNLAKSEIFAAVQKYEMRMLEQQLVYGKPGSSYIHDMTAMAMAPSTTHSDSTSSPKGSYDG